MFGLSHLPIYDFHHSTSDERSILKLAGQNLLGKFIKTSESSASAAPIACLTTDRNLNNVIVMNLTSNHNSSSDSNATGEGKKNGVDNMAADANIAAIRQVKRSQSTKSGKINTKSSSNCSGNNHRRDNSDKVNTGRNNINHNNSGHNNNINKNINNNNNNMKNLSVEELSPLSSLQAKTDTLVDPTKTNTNNGSSSAINANTVLANDTITSTTATTTIISSLKRPPSASASATAASVPGGTTKTIFDMQKQKFIKVITFLNQHNQQLELELAKEKRRRAEELSKIIKSLLCFEAKLKHDKKVINQRLYEKDTEISKLITLNKVLRKKYIAAVALSSTDGGKNMLLDESLLCDLTESEAALNCPNCRKDFYELTGKDVWTQTFTDGRSSLEDHTENGSSSDETVSSSFYGARRSVRYTSKRNFRDYMRSRSMTIDDPSLDNSEENMSTMSRDDSNTSIYGKTNAFSRKMERLHGVRRIESFTDEIDSENDSNRRNKSRNGGGGGAGDYESDEMFMPIKSSRSGSSNSSNYRVKKFAETSPKQEFEASTDDWYASASDVDESENLRAKPYGYNAVNPVLECVNQILLQQSMDECIMDGPPSLESSENNSGSSSSQKDGTVSRKRVHFSIKNSMVHVPRDNEIPPPHRTVIDSSDSKDCNLNYESIYSNEYERIGSEHNSSNLYVDMESKLGQEDCMMIDRPMKKPPALPPKPANLIKFKRVLKITPHPVSIKEDEPKIDSERRMNSNGFVNVGDVEEPDYCSISEVNEAIISVQIVAADVHKSADDEISSNNSEPALSQKTDDVEEIFADIPKLPNVAAIIVPKAINKFVATTTDNYVLKDTPTTTTAATLTPSPTKSSSQIPNILAEINKKVTTPTTNSTSNATILCTPPSTPSKSNGLISSITSDIASSPSKLYAVKSLPEDKLPIQAEFDWYNLDVEYGKSNQPDVIRETDVTSLEYHQMVTVNETDELDEQNDNEPTNGNSILMSTEDSVEYKLDEEFCLINQPDIIKENVYEPSKTISNAFATVVDESPCNGGGGNVGDKVKITRKNFKNFMDASGLSTKPLPRQRKIYFSGPFV